MVSLGGGGDKKSNLRSAGLGGYTYHVRMVLKSEIPILP